MNPAERDRAIKSATEILELLKTMPVETPCASCAFFSPDGMHGHCGHWNAQVPEDARAAGCPSWEEGIPF
jgi:hypothetical protein